MELAGIPLRIKIFKEGETGYIVSINSKKYVPLRKYRIPYSHLAYIVVKSLKESRIDFNGKKELIAEPRDPIIRAICEGIIDYMRGYHLKEANALLSILERIYQPFIFK